MIKGLLQILLTVLALAAVPVRTARADDMRVYWVDRQNYVLLKDLATLYGCKVSGPVNRQVVLQSKWNTLAFTVDGRETRVNQTLVWLHEPMTTVRGHWAIREVDARMVIDPLVRPLRHLQTGGYRTIVIDPGHGGQDTGCKGPRGVEEKRATLDIARRLRTYLMKAGFRVYLTRDGDRFVELDDRSERTRRWGADLFVSIHLNSAASGEAEGVETFSMTSAGYSSTGGGRESSAMAGNRFDALSSQLAYQIHRSVLAQTSAPDRGSKKARFVVLKQAPCPAVLVECGFVSNRREETKLLTDAYRERIAQGLARGILNYAQLARMARREVVPGSGATAATGPGQPVAQPGAAVPLQAPGQPAASAAAQPVQPPVPSPPQPVKIAPSRPAAAR